jgi:hypothetical protein
MLPTLTSCSNISHNEVEIKLRRTVSDTHLEPLTRFLSSVWQLWVSWCGAPSLTRKWLVVQFLLGIARAVTLWSRFLRTHDHILVSQLKLLQYGGPDQCIYIPNEQGGLIIPPAIGYLFRCLWRLWGLRWKYSNPPIHGSDTCPISHINFCK